MNSSAPESSFDVRPVLERQTRVAPHLPALILLTIIMSIDGYDVFVLGQIAPAMAAYFNEPVTWFTMVFVIQQTGLAIGSFLVGPISDRYGRKRLIMTCVVLFGLVTLLTVWARTLLEVAILRGIAGLFLAGVIPSVAAMLTELAPPHRRASFVSIAFTGFTAGVAASAMVVMWLLDLYGWQSAFLIGGIAPLLIAPLFALCTDDSMQFRIRRNPRDERLKRSLLRIDPGLDLTEVREFHYGSADKDAAPIRSGDFMAIFRDGRAPMTLMLWVVFFFAMGMLALVAAWLPTYFHQLAGISLSDWAAYTLLTLIGGLVGTTSIGFLMDRFGRTRILAPAYLLGGISLMLLGYLPFGSGLFIGALLVQGFCLAGGQGGINAVCAQVYPTSIRASGVGIAFGIGRLGGIALPAYGGFILAIGASLAQIFLLIAIGPLLVALALVGVHRTLPTPEESEAL